MRHGEPVAAARGRVVGKLDVGLSDAGRAQVKRATASLRGRGITSVYSSPRRRAHESAALVAEAIGTPLSCDVRLAEIDFGELEGKTYDDVRRAHPELYARWMQHPTTVRFPGGEGYAQLRARVLTCISRLRQQHVGETILVVAHGGVIRCVLAAVLGLPSEHIFRLDQSYGGISRVDYYDEDTPVVRLMNRAPV
ncbi:MAG: histidine phosphatase family protein [Nannocystaceae bacterium]